MSEPMTDERLKHWKNMIDVGAPKLWSEVRRLQTVLTEVNQRLDVVDATDNHPANKVSILIETLDELREENERLLKELAQDRRRACIEKLINGEKP